MTSKSKFTKTPTQEPFPVEEGNFRLTTTGTVYVKKNGEYFWANYKHDSSAIRAAKKFLTH